MSMIIGLVGRQGSGKDEVANILTRRAGAMHIKFATLIKEVAREFGLLELGRVDKELYRTINIKWSVFEKEYPLFTKLYVDYPHAKRVLRGVLEPFRLESKGGGMSADYSISPRRFQQLLGTEVGRVYSDTFWIDQALKGVEGLVVVSDVRFANELDECDHIILIDRDSCKPSLHYHSSEELTETLLTYKNLFRPGDEATYRGVPIYLLENHSNSLSKLSKDTIDLLKLIRGEGE